MSFMNMGEEFTTLAQERAKVAELEADKSKGLDMIRDRLDADPTTVAEAVEGLIKLYKMEFDERDAAEARVAELEKKLQDAAHAYYFPTDDMRERLVGRLVCMCGERAVFVEPSSRREQRAVNCKCGRRWIWRWTDQRGEGEPDAG